MTEAQKRRMAKVMPQAVGQPREMYMPWNDATSEDVIKAAKRFGRGAPWDSHYMLVTARPGRQQRGQTREALLAASLGIERLGGKPERFWLYDAAGQARKVCVQGSFIHDGLYPACPICMGFHIKSETNPNVCPKRAPIGTAKCLVCGYSVYDQVALGLSAREQKKLAGTEAGRLEALVRAHVMAFHPVSAVQLYGYGAACGNCGVSLIPEVGDSSLDAQNDGPPA